MTDFRLAVTVVRDYTFSRWEFLIGNGGRPNPKRDSVTIPTPSWYWFFWWQFDTKKISPNSLPIPPLQGPSSPGNRRPHFKIFPPLVALRFLHWLPCSRALAFSSSDLHRYNISSSTHDHWLTGPSYILCVLVDPGIIFSKGVGFCALHVPLLIRSSSLSNAFEIALRGRRCRNSLSSLFHPGI